MCGKQRGKASIRERERVLCKMVQALLVWGVCFICDMITGGWFEREHKSKVEAIEYSMCLSLGSARVLKSLPISSCDDD